MKNFWDNYEKYRDKANLKDADVSRLGNLSKATLSHSKGQRLTPKLDTAYKISTALNVSLETLINGEETDYDFILKRVKYDDDFRDSVYRLARLKDRERNRVYGMIDTYYMDTQDDIKRESMPG